VVCDLVLSSNADLPSVIGFMSMSVENHCRPQLDLNHHFDEA
jgi:hypothetical protein